MSFHVILLNIFNYSIKILNSQLYIQQKSPSKAIFFLEKNKNTILQFFL